MKSEDDLTKKASSPKTIRKSLIKRENHLGGSYQVDFPIKEWSLATDAASKSALEILDAYKDLDAHEFYQFVESKPPDGFVIQRLIEIALRRTHPDKASQNAKKKATKYDLLKQEVLKDWKTAKADGKSKNQYALWKEATLKELAKSSANGEVITVKAKTIQKWLVGK